MNTSRSHIIMALSPRLGIPGNWPGIFDHVGTHPTVTSKWLSTHIWHGRNQSSHHDRMTTTLIYDQVGRYPSTTSKWPCTYIWSCETTSHSHIRMVLNPRMSIPGKWPGTSIQRMEIALISDHIGTNPTVISKWLSTHIWHGRNQSSHHDRMAQPLYLTMERTNPLTMLEWHSALGWVFLVTDQVPPFREWNSMLIYDHVRTHITVTSEWLSTHI